MQFATKAAAIIETRVERGEDGVTVVMLGDRFGEAVEVFRAQMSPTVAAGLKSQLSHVEAMVD